MIPVLVAMVLWAFFHSYTAGRFKTLFRSRFGERAYHGLYRIFYNIFALLTLAPIMLLMAYSDSRTIWIVDSTPGKMILTAIQLIGGVGLVVSLLQIDILRFAGLRQAWAYFTDQPLPLAEEPLQTRGLYALVRHPLYLFAMLASWPMATMTDTYLGWCIGITVYFVIGSVLEERRLAAAFGDQYTHYRTRVPWLIPFPRPHSSSGLQHNET